MNGGDIGETDRFTQRRSVHRRGATAAAALTALLWSPIVVGWSDDADDRQVPDRQASGLYERAMDHIDAGRVPESRALLREIVDRYPTYFIAYPLLWRVEGRAGDERAMQRSIRESLASFDRVPASDRDESWFESYIAGARLLANEGVAQELRREAVERFPRGMIAQEALLEAARSADDPVQAAASYREFIREFPRNVSWAQLAARGRFEVVVQHPEVFDQSDVIAAAEEFDALSESYVPIYEEPDVRFHALVRIARAVLDIDAELAAGYARRGLAFVRDAADMPGELDAGAALTFRAIEMLAAGRQRRWKEVVERAATLPTLGDAVEVMELHPWLQCSEADLRLLYGEALAATGNVDAAAEQIWLAAALDQECAAERDAFTARHLLTDERVGALHATTRLVLDRRATARRDNLLATMEQRPAPEFSLVNLDGRDVSLADYRGTVVILTFWATWCSPCIRELEKLNAFHERDRDTQVVHVMSISIDSDKSRVAPFVAKRGVEFEVLHGDGEAETRYLGEAGIPQLFVIDQNGYIRFHTRGFRETHFDERLGWMIEAAMGTATAGDP